MTKKGSLLLPLYFVIFFGFIGYSMMITIFTPMFLQSSYSLLPAETSMETRTILLGVSLFLYPFGQFLSSPPLGAFSDHYGRKKILLWSLVFTSLCYVLIAFSVMTDRLILLFISLFLAGLSEGNVTIAQSAIADVTDNHERGKFFGYIFMSASLAYIVGPILGGKLSDRELVPWFNPSLPFWLVFVLLLLVALWVTYRFRETLQKKSHEKIHYLDALGNLKNVFLSKKFRFFFLTNFLFYIAIFGFFRSYPMYLVDEYQMNLSKLSNFVAWVSVPIILVNAGLAAYLFRKFTSWQLTFLSALLLGISIALLILPQKEAWLWLTLFLPAFFIAIGLPAVATLLSTSATPREQGSVLGNNQSLQFFAESVSGLLGGLIAAIFVKLSLIVLGIIALIAAALFLFHPEKASK